MTPNERLASAGEPRHSNETYSLAFAKSPICFSGRADRNRGEWIRRIRQDGCVTEQELRKRLEGLRSEHRDLDAAIHALTEAGARTGAVGASAAAIDAATRDAAASLDPNILNLQITNAQEAPGDPVNVRVTYDLPMITPIFAILVPGGFISITADATQRLE